VIFWLAAMTLCRRELVRFWRQKSRLLGVVASPFLFWLILSFGAGGEAPRFFFPGTLVLTVMFSAIFSTISIIEDRREGFLLSMLVSPAPRLSMVMGKILGSAVLAALQGIVLLVFAPLAGIALTASIVAQAALVLFFVSFALSGLGFFIAWKFDSSQGYHAVMNLVLLPMWFVSGSIFAMESAHGAMRAVMTANPLTYANSALRRLLTPEAAAGEPGLLLAIGVTAAFGAAMAIAAAWQARQDNTRSFA
jgi:ABC-2 type transport system permease protein